MESINNVGHPEPSTQRQSHLTEVLHYDEQVVAAKYEPVKVLSIVKVDVLPDGPGLLPHVSISFWALMLDLESEYRHKRIWRANLVERAATCRFVADYGRRGSSTKTKGIPC